VAESFAVPVLVATARRFSTSVPVVPNGSDGVGPLKQARASRQQASLSAMAHPTSVSTLYAWRVGTTPHEHVTVVLKMPPGSTANMPHEIASETAGVPHEHVPQGSILSTVDAVLRAFHQRYRAASKREKGRIADELVARTGYHRKHALRLLRRGLIARQRSRTYDKRVRDTLVAVWKAAGRPGSRRLKKVLPELLTAMERQGDLRRDIVVHGKLVTASAATIDRLLAPVRSTPLAEVTRQRLESIATMIGELADFTIPADLPPHERDRLKARLADIAQQTLRISRDRREP